MNREMSVAKLAAYLKGVFDDEELLHDVTLVGEVSDISYSDKHTFLVLCEGEFSVRCVHFFSRDAVEKGEKLRLRGSVAFYAARGSVSFTYSEYTKCGDGERNANLAAVKQKLAAAGYFENRPKLGKYITDVVAVTSPDGAAIRDFVRVVHDKAPFVKIHVYPVKVQGVGAGDGIARAIKNIQDIKTDAIVICRGGGSDEDLNAFNDEGLATAVALSRIPVISAVGHEVDYTLCDFCAGTRAGTPSIAGEIVSAHAASLVYDIASSLVRGYSALEQKLKSNKLATERVCTAIAHSAKSRIENGRHAIETALRRGYYALNSKYSASYGELIGAAARLKITATRMLDIKRGEAEKLSSVLSAVDPRRIIKSGFAAVESGGKRVTSASALRVTDEIQLTFSDGSATAVVKSVKSGDNNGNKDDGKD
ncbi:MAG: exodeoxyribonuclease VII large subunit [Clostridiales bacterium]|nr:exodeoxyribonuclease VII large subunit [Clostridiales bacterium]